MFLDGLAMVDSNQSRGEPINRGRYLPVFVEVRSVVNDSQQPGHSIPFVPSFRVCRPCEFSQASIRRIESGYSCEFPCCFNDVKIWSAVVAFIVASI